MQIGMIVYAMVHAYMYFAAYCKCNAAIKLLIEVSKLRKEAPTTACDKIVIIINS